MDDLGGKTPIFGNTHIISQVSVLIIRAVAQSAFWLLLLIASSTLLGHPNDDMLMVYLNWNDNFTSLPWGHSNRVHVFFRTQIGKTPQTSNISRSFLQLKKHPPYQITPSSCQASSNFPSSFSLRWAIPVERDFGGVGRVVSVDVVI